MRSGRRDVGRLNAVNPSGLLRPVDRHVGAHVTEVIVAEADPPAEGLDTAHDVTTPSRTGGDQHRHGRFAFGPRLGEQLTVVAAELGVIVDRLGARRRRRDG